MLTKEQKRDWILENCVNRDGDIILNNLDFSEFDGNVQISRMRVKHNLYQGSHEVEGNLFQSEHVVSRELRQGCHRVGKDVYQGGHQITGDLYQGMQAVKGDLHQAVNSVSGTINQRKQKVGKDLRQDEQEVKGSLFQGGQSVAETIWQQEHKNFTTIHSYKPMEDDEAKEEVSSLVITKKTKRMTQKELEKLLGYAVEIVAE